MISFSPAMNIMTIAKHEAKTIEALAVVCARSMITPTRVLETIEINEKRPRIIEDTETLLSNRGKLTDLFKKMEKH